MMTMHRFPISSQTILSHDTYFHLSLIYNRLSLVKAMRICFYCGLSYTKDDGGGLQSDLFQDVGFIIQVY